MNTARFLMSAWPFYNIMHENVKEYGLVDSKDNEDFAVRLESLRQTWENLCPGFHDWFSRERKQFFESNIIKSMRKQTNVQGLFYNDSIEPRHFREKKEQCFKKATVQEVITILKSLVTRQEDDEIRAMYGSRPYQLSRPFKKFEIDFLKWLGMDLRRRMKHVEQF